MFEVISFYLISIDILKDVTENCYSFANQISVRPAPYNLSLTFEWRKELSKFSNH